MANGSYIACTTRLHLHPAFYVSERHWFIGQKRRLYERWAFRDFRSLFDDDRAGALSCQPDPADGLRPAIIPSDDFGG